MSTPPAVPSPLNQVAYSRPNSPTPSASDDDMNVDVPGQLLNEEEIFAKASIAITSLPHLQTTPTTRLLTCTTCLHGILPSSVISHPTSHNIKLLRDEKRDLQKIVANSSFLNDSSPIPTPTLPCPPIKGLLVQDGFACMLCSFCCPSIRSIQSHFCEKHKDVSGASKDYSKEVQVQAFFSRRPNYFAVTPSLRGHNKDDLFTLYFQQCVPEIEALRVLNPPLNPNEVPPLLKVTQWHEHLKDYTEDRDRVRKLLELTKLPTARQGEAWMGSPLRRTIEAYMKDVRVKANTASLGIKCLLMECPRFVILFLSC